MNKKHGRVCPVAFAGSLDNKIRRWLQNPEKIFGPYINKGMTVLDLGCGSGFFTIDLAQMVGETGRVIAADLQEGMLQKLSNKIEGMEIKERIMLHKCEAGKIGVLGPVDAAIAFYMIHEVPDPINYFKEIRAMLKSDGRFFLIEPKLFHVSKKAFNNTLKDVQSAGFEPAGVLNIFLSRSMIFKKID